MQNLDFYGLESTVRIRVPLTNKFNDEDGGIATTTQSKASNGLAPFRDDIQELKELFKNCKPRARDNCRVLHVSTSGQNKTVQLRSPTSFLIRQAQHGRCFVSDS